MSQTITTRLLESRDERAWSDYVQRSPESSAYHELGWRDVMRESFGTPCHYLLAEDEQQRICGVLPLAELKSYLFGHFLVSLPYFNYAGVCADSPDVTRRLIEHAITLTRESGAAHLEIRNIGPAGTATDNLGLTTKTTKSRMELSLPGTAEALMSSFPAKLRSQVRRPQKEGAYAKTGGVELVDAFYHVFSTNMRDLGTPVYSKSLFRNILERFPDSAWITVVYKDDQPLAAGFLAGFKRRLEIPWASSLRSANHLSPNMLLYWSVLEFACQRQFEVFDFGRSTTDSGPYRFKQQWGAKPVQLHWDYWQRNGGALPDVSPTNKKFNLAINVWRRLPLGVTTLIGPAIIRNIP